MWVASYPPTKTGESRGPCALPASYTAWVGSMRQDFSKRLKLATLRNASGGSCWPAPLAPDHRSGMVSEATQDKNSRPLREFAVSIWNAPQAAVGRRGPDFAKAARSTTGGNLVTQASMWSAPTVADVLGGRKARGGDRSGELLLNGQTALLSSRLDPTTSTPGATPSTSGRQLNPLFTEWLMGWPTGWTASECSEMELSRFKQRMRFELSRLALLDAPPVQQSLF